MSLFNGVPIFGVAVHAPMRPERPAMQVDAFAGQNGVIIQPLGSRGRTWTLSGVLEAGDLPTLISLQVALEGLVESMTVGVFTDEQGNSWPNCILEGTIQWNPMGPHITDFGWVYPYSDLTIRATS